MICYKDKTFCSFWERCRDGKECKRALTKECINQAKEWWKQFTNSDDAPICQYTDKPECFESKENDK
jgi:hypothetical protein